MISASPAPLIPAPPTPALPPRPDPSWHRRLSGEPSLPDLLNEPIIGLMMRRDGVTAEALQALIRRTRAGLRPGRPQTPA